jgi:hypothetical protein
MLAAISTMEPSLINDRFVVCNTAIIATIPKSKVIWTRFPPIIFPTIIPELSIPLRLFNADLILLDISGKDVPTEVIVKPIINSDIPIFFAIRCAAPTTISEPNHNPIIPIITKITSL